MRLCIAWKIYIYIERYITFLSGLCTLTLHLDSHFITSIMFYDVERYFVEDPEDFYSWRFESGVVTQHNFVKFHLDNFPFIAYGSIIFSQSAFVEFDPFKYCAAQIDGPLVFGHGVIPLLNLNFGLHTPKEPRNSSFIYNHTRAHIEEVILKSDSI